ncbi:hypothetical protein MBLNU459_g3219t1 [Dothideomycetes sp. NU459]
MHNPFPPTTSNPGNGIVYLALLPPSTPVLRTVTYQYPLKLISPSPITVTPSRNVSKSSSSNALTHLVHTLYLLTYGGGIVAGDTISLKITLESWTKLVLLTQGSTKIFKSPGRDLLSRQDTNFNVFPGAALCYLPDPVQPFQRSAFEQMQVYNIILGDGTEGKETRGNLCVLDWVCEGRRARGEHWDFWKYASRNEVWLVERTASDTDGQPDSASKETRRLLLRDNILLDPGNETEIGSIARRMDGLGAFGTLILYGTQFEGLGKFFMEEFKLLPRIGGRKWDNGSDDGQDEVDAAEIKRKTRQKQETADGLLWTAAAVRGCVVVKFGAREVEGGKRWLRCMLEAEGSVPDQFGERCLMCLR